LLAIYALEQSSNVIIGQAALAAPAALRDGRRRPPERRGL